MGRTRRERIMLATMGVLTALVIAVYGVALPLINGTQDARSAYAEAVTRHGRIAAKIDALAAMQGGRGGLPSGAFADFIRQSAESAGFTLDNSDPSGPGMVAIRIGSAAPQALFGWLGGLEARGISVDNLTVEPTAPGAGMLTVSATLRRPS